MIDALKVKEALCASLVVVPFEDGLRVATHCLYPSNGVVTVVIRGGEDAFIVTDDGGAISEAGAAGFQSRAADKQIRGLLKLYGLKVQNGSIVSPVVERDELVATIMLVANAAKEVAEWSLAHLRFEPRRNFKADLADLLARHFTDNDKPASVVGNSNRSYKFEHMIHLNNGRRLIIDPVVNDSSSINARVVANLDVKMAGAPGLEQLIVYDDQVNWSSADLKVLEVGARTVPFSSAESVIKRVAVA